MSICSSEDYRTAKQWLALKNDEKRYPIRGAVGVVRKRGEYFHKSQTRPVKCEATHHPDFNISPIPVLYKGYKYYYFDECEEKNTPNQWRKQKLIVIPGSIPCSGSRSGFNPTSKQHFEYEFFLKSDTRPMRNNGL